MYRPDRDRKVAERWCNLREFSRLLLGETELITRSRVVRTAHTRGHMNRARLARPTAPPDSVGDNQLIDYSAFFQGEYPRVVRTVYLVVRDKGRAEELTQEAFIQLFRHWKKISGYDRPEAWVRRVAIRLAIRNTARERLRTVLERQTAIAPEAEKSGTDVSGALQRLSASQRAVIVLHYYEDRPVEEVADILSCSQNTVKSHLHRGRNQLRELLREGGGD